MNITSLTSTTFKSRSDFLGILASSLCMIHCLATPVFFVVQACTSSCCAAGPWWWRMVDYLFLVISIGAIYQSTKMTSLKWMPKAMYICWGALAFLILNESLSILPIPHLFVYLPAFSLVFLHVYNLRHCRCEEEKCCTAKQNA